MRTTEADDRFHPTILAGLAVAVGASLALASITKTGFWLDELYSYYYASQDLTTFIYIISQVEMHMAVYYGALHFWLMGGDSEIYIRSLSILFALASIGVIYRIGSMVNKRTGGYAALLMALSPFFLCYAQEARSYSLTILLTSLAAMAFLNLARGNDSWRMKLLFVLSSILSLYTHMFSALVLADLYLSLLATPRRIFSRDLILLSLVIVMGALPHAWFVIHKASTQLDWVHPSTWRSVVRLFYDFTSSPQVPDAARRGILACFLVPFCLSFVGYLKSSGDDRNGNFLFTIHMWCFVPILLAYTVSLWSPAFVPRYLIVSLPAFMLAVAIGIASIPALKVRSVLLVSLATLMVISIHFSRQRSSEDWRGLYGVLAEKSSKDSMIYFHPHILRFTYPYFVRVYDSLDHFETRVLPLPITASLSQEDFDVSRAADVLPSQGPQKLWLVLAHDEIPPLPQRSAELRHLLDMKASRMKEWEFSGNLRLILYEFTNSRLDDGGAVLDGEPL